MTATNNKKAETQAPQASARAFYQDGTTGTGDTYEDGSPKYSGTNGIGDRTVSVLPPSGGKDGDIWYQVQ